MAMMQSASAKAPGRDSRTREPHPAQLDGLSRLEGDPVDGEAAYAQGTAYLSQGKRAEATAWLQHAAALLPDRAEVQTTLGIALAGQERWEEAEASFRRVVELRPGLAEAWNDLGNLLRMGGRLDEAIACFEEAVRLRTDCVEAYLNLGLALITRRRWNEAANHFRRALELRPGEAGGHHHLASALAAQGKWEEAVGHYHEALRLRPGSAETHSGLGNVLRSLGRPAEALSHFLRALQIRPDALEVHASLAETLAVQGQRDEAIAYVWRVLHHRPPSHAAYSTLGATLLRLDQNDDAERCLRLALELGPDDAESLNNLGTCHWKRRRLAEAEVCYRQALELKPDDPDIFNNLGNALWELKRIPEAQECYRQALVLRPHSPESHLNLGIVLSGEGIYAEAEAQINESIRLRPHSPAAHNALGMTLARQGKFAEALACYEEALRIQPDFAESRRNRAMIWLVRGDLERGWSEHEWRWKCRNHPMPPLRRPLWQGEDLHGKTILLHAEQGFGDTLQFIRYASLVKRSGGTVVFVGPECLVRLLSRCPGIDRMSAAGWGNLPEFDVHAPLMSLPAILKTTMETIPAEIPYLFADAEEGIETWHAKLAPLTGLKIGIAWQGNPEHRLDRDRSFPLTALAPLASVADVHLISLQKGFGTEQLRTLNGRFSVIELEHLEPSLRNDFLETAQVIKNLDLVVTPDSAIAHLTGGLGVPVWLAMHAVPECRWLLDREDCPWYPSMRLFRQTEAGDWSSVFQRMADALTSLPRSDASSDRKDILK